MAFRFTLEAVLRYRRSLEDREQMRLQPLLARRAGLQGTAAEREAQLQLQTAAPGAAGSAPVGRELHLSVAGLRGWKREVLLQSQLQPLQTEITAADGALPAGAAQAGSVGIAARRPTRRLSPAATAARAGLWMRCIFCGAAAGRPDLPTGVATVAQPSTFHESFQLCHLHRQISKMLEVRRFASRLPGWVRNLPVGTRDAS